MKEKKSFCSHYLEQTSVKWVKTRMWCGAFRGRESRTCLFYKRSSTSVKEEGVRFFTMCAWSKIWYKIENGEDYESSAIECTCLEARAHTMLEEI